MRTSILVSTSNDLSLSVGNFKNRNYKQVYAGVVETGDELNINIAYHLAKISVVGDTWVNSSRAEHCNNILKEHIRKLKQNPKHSPNLETLHLRIHVGDVEALN